MAIAKNTQRMNPYYFRKEIKILIQEHSFIESNAECRMMVNGQCKCIFYERIWENSKPKHEQLATQRNNSWDQRFWHCLFIQQLLVVKWTLDELYIYSAAERAEKGDAVSHDAWNSFLNATDWPLSRPYNQSNQTTFSGLISTNFAWMTWNQKFFMVFNSEMVSLSTLCYIRTASVRANHWNGKKRKKKKISKN